MDAPWRVVPSQSIEQCLINALWWTRGTSALPCGCPKGFQASPSLVGGLAGQLSAGRQLKNDARNHFAPLYRAIRRPGSLPGLGCSRCKLLLPWGSCTDALGLMHPDRKTCIAFLKVYATLKAAVGGPWRGWSGVVDFLTAAWSAIPPPSFLEGTQLQASLCACCTVTSRLVPAARVRGRMEQAHRRLRGPPRGRLTWSRWLPLRRQSVISAGGAAAKVSSAPFGCCPAADTEQRRDSGCPPAQPPAWAASVAAEGSPPCSPRPGNLEPASSAVRGAAGVACCSCYAEQAALCQAANQQHWCKACRTRTAAPLPDHCPAPPRQFPESPACCQSAGAGVMRGPRVQHTRRPPGGEGACRAAVPARDVLCHHAGCRPWTEGHGGDKALPLAIACLDSQAACRSGQRYRGQQGAGISRCSQC